MQRSKEIGVMKAVGYQNRDVKGIFYLRRYLDCRHRLVTGLLVAQGVGSLANAVVNHFYPSITKVFELNLLSVLGTLAFCSITWLCLSLLPST